MTVSETLINLTAQVFMKISFIIIYLLFVFCFATSAQRSQQVYSNQFEVRDDSLFNIITTSDKFDSSRYYHFTHPKNVFSRKRARQYKDFLYNRSKVYMKDSVSGQPHTTDDTIAEWRPLFCDGFISKDTLIVSISTGLVLDSYKLLAIKIYKDTFNFQYSIFYSPGDWGIRFLKNENDTDYDCIAKPTTEYQYLLLKNKPVFQKHHQLTGYLRFITEPFFETNSNIGKLEKHIVFGKLFFTCKIKSLPRKKDNDE